MAFIFEDRVRDTTTTSGTGNITLAGVAPINYRTFGSVLTTGDNFPYTIVSRSANEWETGVGTSVSATVFSRSVVRSSNANALVNFSAATTKDVVMAITANDRATMRHWLPGSGLLVPNVQSSVQGNPASTTETTLLSYTLPANALNTVGQGVNIFAAGYWGTNASRAQIRLYFGSDAMLLDNFLTDGSRWNAEYKVVMSASNQVMISGRANANFLVGPYGANPTVTLTSTVLIKVTGQSIGVSVASQAVCYQLLVAPLLTDIASFMG